MDVQYVFEAHRSRTCGGGEMGGWGPHIGRVGLPADSCLGRTKSPVGLARLVACILELKLDLNAKDGCRK